MPSRRKNGENREVERRYQKSLFRKSTKKRFFICQDAERCHVVHGKRKAAANKVLCRRGFSEQTGLQIGIGDFSHQYAFACKNVGLNGEIIRARSHHDAYIGDDVEIN